MERFGPDGSLKAILEWSNGKVIWDRNFLSRPPNHRGGRWADPLDKYFLDK